MSRFLLSLLLAGVVAAGVTAGTEAKPKPKPKPAATFAPVPANQQVDLTLVTYMPLIGAGAQATLNSLLGSFQSAHPNIHVTVQTSSTANGAGVNTVVQQDEAAGKTPDLVQVVLDSVSYYAHGGFGAVDLKKVAGAQGLAAEWGGKYPYEQAVRKLGQVGGTQYVIPWVLSTPILFYNADLFRKAGLDPSKPPTTWAQVQSDALAIKKATGADGIATCMAGAAASGSDWCAQAAIFSNGGTVLSGNGKNLTWTSPATVSAVQTLGQLGTSGAMPNLSSAQIVQEFAQQKLGMVINSSALQATLVSAAQGNFQMLDAELPGFGSKQSVPTNSGSGLSILSKDSLHQRAAWELLQWLTSPSAYTQITKNIGYAPLRSTLVTDKNGLFGWHAAQKDLVAPNLAQLKRLVAWQSYPGSNFTQVETLLLNAIGAVAFQGQSAASALAQAQSQAQALLSS